MSDTLATHRRTRQAINDILLLCEGQRQLPHVCGFSGRIQILGVRWRRPGRRSRPSTCSRTTRSARASRNTAPGPHPQLYVKGEFVGGSDIMMEMYEGRARSSCSVTANK